MRGRGHKKLEQSGITTRISYDRNTPIIRLPKALLELGVKLSQEIILVYEKGSNPLTWEIKIKPKPAEKVPVPA